MTDQAGDQSGALVRLSVMGWELMEFPLPRPERFGGEIVEDAGRALGLLAAGDQVVVRANADCLKEVRRYLIDAGILVEYNAGL